MGVATILLVLLIWGPIDAQTVDDIACVDALPTIEYLGEYPDEFTLPDGYSTFVVKRHNPFRFDLEGNATGGGAITYATVPRECVWPVAVSVISPPLNMCPSILAT